MFDEFPDGLARTKACEALGGAAANEWVGIVQQLNYCGQFNVAAANPRQPRGLAANFPCLVASESQDQLWWQRGKFRRNELHGAETVPTLYWRDRTKDGPTYHIDYVFLPSRWIGKARVDVGTFETWCGAGLSDHVPVIVDVDV